MRSFWMRSFDALGAKDAPTLFGAVSRVVATGQDPRRFVEDLLERLRDLIVVKAGSAGCGSDFAGSSAGSVGASGSAGSGFG